MSYCSLNKCRTCLDDSVDLLTVTSLNLSTEMFLLITYLDIQIIEGLPNSICKKCVAKFENIIAFKQQCLVSLTVLQNLYKEQCKELNKATSENLETKKDNIPFVDIKEETYDLNGDVSIKREISDNNSQCHGTQVTNDYNFDDTHSSPENYDGTKSNKTGKRKKKRIKVKETPECKICNKIYANNRNLKRHNEQVHSNSPKPYCEECKKFYDSKTTYECHMRKFHSNKNREKTICTICGTAVFKIKMHMQSTHADPSIKFPCPHCEKVFKSATLLRKHELIFHENPEKYQKLCPECGRVFRTIGDMKVHFKCKHSTERQYQCQYCERAFKICHQRNKHERVAHFNERPFKCNMCSKTFTGKFPLDRHIRTHTGEKPFVCDLCSKSFAQKTALKTHKRLVHALEITSATEILESA